MRRDNTIFFAAGLAFGVLLGYFVFSTVSQRPAPAPAIAGAPSRSNEVPSRRLIDPQELAALESMLEQNPDDNEIRIQMGNLYLEAGRYEESIPWFRDAVEREPGSMHARSHLADALSNSGRLDDAVAEYESILSLDPENPQGLLGLGRLKLYALQDIGGGVEAWEKLLEVAPSSREANSIRDELEALQSAHAPQ